MRKRTIPKRYLGEQTGARWCAALVMAVALAGTLAGQPGTQELRLTVGKSVVIDYPADVGRISTSNPDVVDAVPITAREILLNAKTLGQSTVVVWSKAGERAFFSITVEQNLEAIQKMLKESFPNEQIEIRATRDSATLNGRVSSLGVAERAVAMVTPLVKSVVNNLTLVSAGADKQVMLRVKFAELNRSKVSQFGLNIISTGAANTPGQITTGQFGASTPANLRGTIGAPVVGTSSSFTITDALNIFAFRPDINLTATIRALQSSNVLQILAEPNLLTTTGKEATFLAGGEFPIPVLQGGGNAGAITIQFREFGIRLKFLPVVTPHATVKMQVRSELSTIDLSNAVVFSGFTIPALSTRRADTEIELGEGQSFVVAGLLDDRVTENLFKIPGLSNIPILGELFKSRAHRKDKTELIVMVTPEIMLPIQQGAPRPASKMMFEGTEVILSGGVPGQKEHEAAVTGPGLQKGGGSWGKKKKEEGTGDRKQE